MNRNEPKRAAVLLPILLLAGCAVLRGAPDRSDVSEEIERRVGSAIGSPSKPGEFTVPEGVSLDDGLTESEAVAVALWNNAALQADLATLGIARADLQSAGLLRNPVLSFLFPRGPKQTEATLAWPLEEIWQRPRRVAAAKLDVRSVADNLVQHGLGLVRDTRIAFAEIELSERRARLLGESARLLDEIAEITQARLMAGDTSELEAGASRIEAFRARDAARRLAHEIETSRYRLLLLLGIGPDAPRVEIIQAPSVPHETGELSALIVKALAARPDLRAAETKIEAEGKRVGWERSRVFRLIGLLDANAAEGGGFDVGPGLQWEIPVLNPNRDGITRAQARLQQAAWEYVAARQRIVLAVQESHARYRTAGESHRQWNEDIVPSLQETLRGTESAHQAGEVSWLAVLEMQRRLLEARIHEAEALADLERERANLIHSVGTDPFEAGRS